MVPFESLGTVSYSHFKVTMALSCIISDTKRDIGRKSRFFSYPLHLMSPSGGPRWSIPFDIKNRIVWLPGGENKSEDMFIAVVMDRWTDRQTDILRQQQKFSVQLVELRQTKM